MVNLVQDKVASCLRLWLGLPRFHFVEERQAKPPALP
jgi:hypothetical protein